MTKIKPKIGADLVVDTLINQNVKYIFGIPGAKIDQVFDVLCDRGPKLIVARHEQNAAFMAAAIGRITQKPGVVLVTSGPGACNLATGLVTANVEGDPIVAIAGNVQREDLLKRTHQSMDNAALFNPITKFSKEVSHQDNISEVLTDAFHAALTPRKGASFVSLPADIIKLPITISAINLSKQPQEANIPSDSVINLLVKSIKEAKMPVFFLGMRASTIENTQAIRDLVTKYQFPIVETFQAAGVISRELESHFYGRIGLFKNQPGDQLLHAADLIITIGFDPVEYYPRIWNKNNKTIIHIDEIATESDTFYQPKLEIVGNIALILAALIAKLPIFNYSKAKPLLTKLQDELKKRQLGSEFDLTKNKGIHPLQLINTLRQVIADDVTVTCDVGSHYIWMARYFRSYEARTLLFSNGMQTLGVALPWAIGAALVRPNKTILSMSGDGGFLFSSMELETAVRLKLPIIHLIWNDGGRYDMVAFQQIMKYQRDSGVNFNNPDFVKYAESFGAIGLRVNKLEQLKPILIKALTYNIPVVIDIVVNYQDNIKLGKSLLEDQFN